VEALLVAMENTPLFAADHPRPPTSSQVTAEHYAFVQLLCSGTQSIRLKAAESLYEIITAKHTSVLAPRYTTMQQRCAELLFNLSGVQTSTEYLILALGDDNAEERLRAIKTLFAHTSIDARLIPPLQKALADESMVVRAYAGKALARLGGVAS
jgi:HEAT repeat protein